MSDKWKNLWLLAFAELLGMAVWFSASAVVPQLTEQWDLGPAARSWLTMSVQIGFVCGALTSALTNLADRFAPPRLIAISTLVAAICNGVIALSVDAVEPALVLRFFTALAYRRTDFEEL